MTIDVGWFVPGVLLLVFPADRLLSRLVELRSFDCFQSLEDSPRHRPWWWVPALWIDPVRAYAGTMLLRAALLRPGLDWAETEKGSYALFVTVLAAAVIAQLFKRREREALLAPLGFVAGIVAALAPWAVSLLGLTVALTAMFAFRRFYAFFGVGMAAVGGLGFAFGARPMWFVPALAVLALPLLAGMITGRSLELPARNALPAGRAGLKRLEPEQNHRL